MATYILRRLVAAFFIVLGASFIVYMLMANAGDPLAFTAEIANPTQRQAIDRLGHRGAEPRRQPGRPATSCGSVTSLPGRLRHLRPHPAAGHRRSRRAGSR